MAGFKRVVDATGIAVKRRNKAESQKIEQAMQQALRDARTAGITDPAERKRRMMEARRQARS